MEQMKTDPVNEQKINANLAKIASEVRRLQVDNLSKFEIEKIQKEGWYNENLISRNLAVRFIAKSPLFKSLNTAVYFSEASVNSNRSQDEIGLKASIDTNSFHFLKQHFEKKFLDEGKRKEEVVDQLKSKCGSAQIMAPELAEDPVSGLSCVLELSILTSTNFDTWIETLAPRLPSFRKSIQDAIMDAKEKANQLYPDQFIKNEEIELQTNICRRSDESCMSSLLEGDSESLKNGFLTATVKTRLKMGEIKLATRISENALEISLALLGPEVGGTQRTTDSSAPSTPTTWDLVRYEFLKQIEKMSDEEITSQVKSLASFIDEQVKNTKQKSSTP
ncbi:MAG: hypothetical protein C5B49_03445 [Bdellovibrio sp.]|nr:MAG: hypothetical protein C5B49_03445 [Bdellovibrio sp.]